MNTFQVGDVVTDGTRVGVIADGFYWKDADDGTQNEPKIGNLPIWWNDGTKGYRLVSELEYA